MNIIDLLKSRFVKAVGVTAIVSQVAACADIDPNVAAAAGAAAGYGIGSELNSDWGGYVGGAVGAAVANAASNRARACETNTTLEREAVRDNRTGHVGSDQTYQSQSENCTRYGGTPRVVAVQPIF